MVVFVVVVLSYSELHFGWESSVRERRWFVLKHLDATKLLDQDAREGFIAKVSLVGRALAWGF